MGVTKIIEAINTKSNITRACAYCRVSTDMSHQINSYEVQKEYYKNFITEKPNHKFVGIYADYGKSGTKEEGRTEFERMLEDCKNGMIDIIYTKSISRFARNAIDCLSIVRNLKELKVDVYFEKEKIHTLSEKSEVLLSIYSSVAQAESESISTNQKWSVQKRFLDGTYIMSNPAYGYCNNKKGRLKLSQKEAKIVRFIYDEYLNGKGIHIIARELSESKIKSPKGNKIWNSATVYGILKNPIYTGDILHQKTYSMNIVPFERKINKGEVPQILIENDHKAIVSKEEYETVQIMLSCKHKNEKNEVTEFRGKIICSKCGDVFYRQVKPKQDITWTCKNRIISKDYCDMDIVKEELIKELFMKMWNKLSNNYEKILIPMVESLYAIKEHTGENQVIKDYENKINELIKQSNTLNQLIQKRCIDSAFYIQQKNMTEQKIIELNIEKVRYIEKSQMNYEIRETEKLIDLIKNSPKAMNTYNKDLFKKVVDKILISKGEITFILKNKLECREYRKGN